MIYSNAVIIVKIRSTIVYDDAIENPECVCPSTSVYVCVISVHEWKLKNINWITTNTIQINHQNLCYPP